MGRGNLNVQMMLKRDVEVGLKMWIRKDIPANAPANRDCLLSGTLWPLDA